MTDGGLFDHPAEPVATVDGATHAALLGDASPVRRDEPQEAESVETLAAAGTVERCPSCGVQLPDPSHPVDAARRHGSGEPPA